MANAEFSAESGSSNVQRLVLGAFQRAASRVLALDGDIASKLAPLEGRAVTLTLAKPTLRVLARVHGGTVRFALAEANDVADLSLSTELSSLLQMGMARLTGGKPSLGVGKLHMSGDAEMARQLQQIVERFEPDWDAPFSDMFGDVRGFQLARGARKALDFAKNTAASFAASSSEYLREESREVLSAAELEGFYDDVDTLKDRVARAEQRVAALRSKLKV
jgi:ubiquinone biosynthesis accessory factor UbiJ